MRSVKVYSKKQTILYSSLLFFFGIIIVLIFGEVLARFLEGKKVVEGTLSSIEHAELGWLPKPGSSGINITGEFSARYTINSLGMNDDPIEQSVGVKTKILAIGDSHTYAVGASVDEVWPNVLEDILFEDEGQNSGVVFNAGVAGYSLGQYLLRMRDLSDKFKLNVVIIGFSMATDLYDLIPPERGGFIYGAGKGRVYFDLTSEGKLLEVRKLVGKTDFRKSENSDSERDLSMKIRQFLGNFALYRHLKRSNIAMWIAMRWQPGNRSLLPALDTALKINLSSNDKYRWLLAEKILFKLSDEAKSKGINVVLVNIPYLAQVYDEVWNSSFGSFPERYDRWIAGKRLRDICERGGIHYIDTTPPIVEEVRKKKIWLHHPKDAHPTPDGHRIIAQTIAAELRNYNLVQVDH